MEQRIQHLIAAYWAAHGRAPNALIVGPNADEILPRWHKGLRRVDDDLAPTDLQVGHIQYD
ncbi:MAG: hypothetical protein EBR99_04130 [Actinobacteria bacterium]|nr:hypothetical protein [Actinomycetota bacterium]